MRVERMGPEPPQERQERRLLAIFAADIAGYSRLMRADEQGTLRARQVDREIIDRLISEHGGRIANTAGDSILAEFPSVVDAVRCALTVQREVAEANDATRPDEQRLQFRIGVHVGDVVVRDGDLFGDGVNVAARLQAIAEPGGVCLSEGAHRYAARLLSLTCADLGHQDVKNIDGGIRVFSVRPMGQPAPAEPSSPPTGRSGRPTVAVLPFAELSGNGAESYFSDGITDEIITGLARFRSLFVVARNSSFAFQDQSLDLAEVGRRLGVSFLVEGSVRRAGDRLRVTAQLIEAGTGIQLWAERYDRRLDDVFAVQDEVAQMIASTLFGRIQDAKLQEALRKPTDSMEAYDCYLRGLAHFRMHADDSNQQAAAMLERAVALDPQYALAQSYLAWVRVAVDGYAAATPAVVDAAFAMAARAVDLDPAGMSLPWAARPNLPYPARIRYSRAPFAPDYRTQSKRRGWTASDGVCSDDPGQARGSASVDGHGSAPQSVPPYVVQLRTWRHTLFPQAVR